LEFRVAFVAAADTNELVTKLQKVT